jgi:hypothetical protein
MAIYRNGPGGQAAPAGIADASPINANAPIKTTINGAGWFDLNSTNPLVIGATYSVTFYPTDPSDIATYYLRDDTVAALAAVTIGTPGLSGVPTLIRPSEAKNLCFKRNPDTPVDGTVFLVRTDN